MTLKKDTVKNLVKVFFMYYPTEEDKKIALSIYKILDFKYDFDKGELIYYGTGSPVYFYKTDYDNPLKDEDNLYAKNATFEVTPVELSLFDLDCVRQALSQFASNSDALKLSPVLEAIGWIIRCESDGFNVHFVGSASYEVWKEPIIPWDYDLEEDACDWKSGDDWRDGFNLERDFPPKWTD